MLIGCTTSATVMVFAKQLLNFFTPGAPLVIEAGMRRLLLICVPYFLCGLMDTSAAMNKGIGKQIVPTVIILIGNCLLRVIWVMAVRSLFPGSPETPNNIYYLYLSYPVTWTLSFIGNGIYYLIIRKKLLSGRLDIRI